MEARSNGDDIMPNIQTDAALCVLCIYEDLGKTILAVSNGKNTEIGTVTKVPEINRVNQPLTFSLDTLLAQALLQICS